MNYQIVGSKGICPRVVKMLFIQAIGPECVKTLIIQNLTSESSQISMLIGSQKCLQKLVCAKLYACRLP